MCIKAGKLHSSYPERYYLTVSGFFLKFFLILTIKVESNDTLYGSDGKFLKELNRIISSLLEDVFEILQNSVSFD